MKWRVLQTVEMGHQAPPVQTETIITAWGLDGATHWAAKHLDPQAVAVEIHAVKEKSLH